GWDFKHIARTMRSGFWSVLAPLVILGGIYSGFFTPTESAIVAIFYTLFVGAFIHRELTWSAIFRSLETTTWLS
ncbi:TRAP transporter large permease subunit, partial [Marinomonas sp. TI.3.20]